ncbi:unnamed protein product, partial [Porites lobata]
GAIAQRWRKWIKRLENLLVAAAITDKKRQRALVLYYAGEEVCEIFETLVDTGDDFTTAKEKLTEYFDPKKNVEYEIYTFLQARQNPDESMNAFHSRLRQLSATCEFDDVDKEIKSQIILSCSSQRYRRKALRDTTMTLETLLNEARDLEISETQAKDIESQPRGRGNPKEKKKQNVNPLEAECEEREASSSSDDEYTFRLEVPSSKVGAPFVSLKVNGAVCKFLVDSEASVNIVSSHAVKLYPSLSSGLGKMKNVEVKLHIDVSVSPVHQTHRRIPFHQRKCLEACLESLLQQDIIEPAVGPTSLDVSRCLSPKAKATWWCSFVSRYA